MSKKLIHAGVVLLGLALASVAHAQKFYSNENSDDGIEARSAYRYEDYHAPTPLAVPGATTIYTEDLYNTMQSENKPLLIDVLGGPAHGTIVGAVWWPGAGVGHRGESGSKDALTKFTRKLDELSGGDKAKPVVFFCLSSLCWLSYNASLRALAAGYTNVMWYRGGLESWKAARNSLTPSGPSKY